MSTASAQVIAAYECLPTHEKQLLVREILSKLPPFDSGPLDDEQVALAGDQLAATFEKDEHGAQTR